MGDNFLKRQARNFRKGRDRAKAEQRQRVLFNRPEVLDTIYTAQPERNCRFQSGETLLAVVSEDGQRIVLARGHERTGHVEGDGAQSLAQALIEGGGGGVTEVRITEVSGLSGSAKAVIVNNG